MRCRGRPGHADERDGLTARDSVADRHECERGVVVAALQIPRVQYADSTTAERDPTDRIDDAVIRRDDDRAVGGGDVDAGVASLYELRDRAGDRPHEAARVAADARVPRARGGVGAQVDAASVGAATTVDLELRRIEAGARRADEVAPVRAEGTDAEQVRECRELVSAPHPEAIEGVAAGDRRRHRAEVEAAVRGPTVDAPGEIRDARGLPRAVVPHQRDAVRGALEERVPRG